MEAINKNKNWSRKIKGSRSLFSKAFGLHFLNITQFLGTLNDNVYKFLAVFLLIEIKGLQATNEIMFWIGIVYVIPFLFLSSYAGILADRVSKQKIIVAMKIFEVFITLTAFVAFYTRSEFAVYSCGFLLAAQSAIFAPPKFSIIPELVPPNKISKANGLITSSTYLAIILGSFLASFLTQMSSRNYLLTIVFCIVISLVGVFTAFCIPKSPKQIVAKGYESQKKKPSAFFLKDIISTLRDTSHLANFPISFACSFFFLFLGAFLQLNIVPYAIETMGMSDVSAGYLFVILSIGIVLGAYIAGKTKRKSGNLGLPCLAILIIAISLFLLPLLKASTLLTALDLILLGLGGGMFIVPIDSYIQTFAPENMRGKIVAASNFLSFTGVLMAPFCLRGFSEGLHLSAASGFVVLGFICLGIFLYMSRKLSYIFLSYASKKLLHPLFSIKVIQNSDIDQEKPAIFFTSNSFYASLLLGLRPKSHLYIAKPKKGFFDGVFSYYRNVDYIYYEDVPAFVKEIFDVRIRLWANKTEGRPCLVIAPSKTYQTNDFQKLREFFKERVNFIDHNTLPKQRKGVLRFLEKLSIGYRFTSYQEVKAPEKHRLFRMPFRRLLPKKAS